jgi:hypothetical protein
MSPWLVILCGIIYAAVAIDQGLRGNIAIFIMYGCYAVSNIGVYMLLK